MMSDEKQRVVDAVIEQTKNDLLNGDATVLEEILSHVPIKILIHSLPEEEWVKYPTNEPFYTEIWNNIAKALSQ